MYLSPRGWKRVAYFEPGISVAASQRNEGEKGNSKRHECSQSGCGLTDARTGLGDVVLSLRVVDQTKGDRTEGVSRPRIEDIVNRKGNCPCQCFVASE